MMHNMLFLLGSIIHKFYMEKSIFDPQQQLDSLPFKFVLFHPYIKQRILVQLSNS